MTCRINQGDDCLNKLDLIVEYINHSSFTVKVDNQILIFDNYKGDANLKDEDKDKNISVFASHSHWDHFDSIILDWREDFKNIQYILSNDILIEDKEGITFIGPYKEVDINNIKVRTFGSTDKGVSFLVSLAGVNIFHAGDLNWWHWDDDKEMEKINMENSFKIKVDRIKNSGLDIDIAFFPVDPRLEDFFHIGGEYFIRELKPKYFFPMHLWDNYGIIEKFIHKIGDLPTIIVDIKHKNQIFEL